LQGQRGKGGVVFHWDAFSIGGMVEEKMVNKSFGRAADHGR